MATPRQFPWELVSQVKDHRTMERLETAWDLSGYYAEMLTHLILQVNLDDPSFDPSERSFLRQCLADKGTNLELPCHDLSHVNRGRSY